MVVHVVLCAHRLSREQVVKKIIMLRELSRGRITYCEQCCRPDFATAYSSRDQGATKPVG